MTTRKVEREGLGEKSELELENRKLEALGLPNSHEQIRALRIGWEELANEHLARAGLDLRIDHRSHADRGLEIEPTQHMGVHATEMARRGREVSRVRLETEAARRNAELIQEKPEHALALITAERSVFDRRDVARVLHRYLDGPEAFQAALARVMASPALVELVPEVRGAGGEVTAPARYSTREMVAVEREMALSADHMTKGHGLRGGRPAGRGGAGGAAVPGGGTTRGDRACHRARTDRGGGRAGRCRQEHDAGGGARGLGGRRATGCTARPWPARRPRAWRKPPASARGRWRAGNGAGSAGSTGWVPATCW